MEGKADRGEQRSLRIQMAPPQEEVWTEHRQKRASNLTLQAAPPGVEMDRRAAHGPQMEEQAGHSQLSNVE